MIHIDGIAVFDDANLVFFSFISLQGLSFLISGDMKNIGFTRILLSDKKNIPEIIH
ncbi:MAG: hypothetical protein K1X92_17325 [Bacteroidia bacterium]|nr:hypothetical protein [Bacteroidia bacterium]